VGEKLPMNVLVREYAQADPRFVAKTEVGKHSVFLESKLTIRKALAATHSAYRPIKGDGQCGWRGKLSTLGHLY
jgi:hypothetical protein